MPARRRRPSRLVAASVVLALGLLAGCGGGGSDDGAGEPTTAPPNVATTNPADVGFAPPIALSVQAGGLEAHAIQPDDRGAYDRRLLLETGPDAPGGLDLHGQICLFLPVADQPQRFLSAQDVAADGPGGGAGWGIFELTGRLLDELEVRQVGRLETTYQPSADDPATYGCGILPDGRIVTTDVGARAEGEGTGQLTIWFPPDADEGGDLPDGIASCKLDVTLPTAQSILVRDGQVHVAAARGDVYRYPGPLPTGPDAAGGCGGVDATGAPLAEGIVRQVAIAAGSNGLITPSGLAAAPGGRTYVSSVLTGFIDEYGPDGAFLRTILQPQPGEALGDRSTFSTGTPAALATGPDGTLYFADLGLVTPAAGVGPGEETGAVRRIRFVSDQPQLPDAMAVGLERPSGIAVWFPPPPPTS